MSEMVSALCTGISSMNWLSSDHPESNIPLVFMGFSYGTYVAYECIKKLEKEFCYVPFHLISIAGIAIEQLRLFPNLDDMDGDTMTEKIRNQFIATHGKEPPKFGHKGFSKILEPMLAGTLHQSVVAQFIFNIFILMSLSLSFSYRY